MTNRLLSLDVFRGLTIALMILVNTPGTWSAVYPPLLHAKWHGCTPTDLVFPFFLFIVGVSMFMSFAKYEYQLTGAATQKILRRTALIFLVGLALNWFPFYHKHISELRIMGVLQRIALAYGVAAFILLSIPRHRLFHVGGAILLFYWDLMYFLGGTPPYELETNFAKDIDVILFGESHVYGGFGIPFDPEGLISTIPSVVTVMLGYHIGSMIKTIKDRSQLVKEMMILGVIGIFIGLVWNMAFPINKPLWTSSYVVYTAGIGAIVLALCIEFIDIRNKKGWTHPFVVFGMNSLFSYALSGVIIKLMMTTFKWTNAAGETINLQSWLYNDVFKAIFQDAKFSSFLFAISYVALIWLFSKILYNRKIFIKL